jgi:GntR family transcriptional regulator, transcriptional repressor for pyruvate dehydrogenase complex
MTTRKHEEIADSLTRDILVGQYRPGERLPSERDLAARFDANRGAVREAMKKLEQLGLATVQPGGARVVPLHEASLDVIGHLLALGELPDADLVDQILQVMQSLITVAAESAVRRASDEEMAVIRSRVRALLEREHDRTSHAHARIELMSAIMEASGNLVCRLIARSLLLQFAPRMAPLECYVELNLDAHREYAQRLDAALGARDVEAVRATFEALSNFNRDAARQAFAAIERGASPSAKVASS